jgi:hypothetical protein
MSSILLVTLLITFGIYEQEREPTSTEWVNCLYLEALTIVTTLGGHSAFLAVRHERSPPNPESNC